MSIVLSRDVVLERFGERVVVLNALTGRVFELNSTAIQIWEQLQVNKSLASAVLVEHGQSPEDAVRWIDQFISQLADAGLIQQ